ncbi:glycosyltransferase family 2 protein [Pseudonocardia xishanensis]|uniref:Glycosyltransferase 2-like domain-containing protein n=1 Tax=Pseudonocardia xishanensis TaxID=630995 RepID=A0ABP8RFG9_9PSEU
MLPGLDRLGLPIPLGGTSNHFRTAALRRLGGWDPFNVTEDADLGIRAAALGHTVGVINSTTFEEANRAPGNWVRQRSRWIKGYLQTLLVHLRHPVRRVRTASLKQTLVTTNPDVFAFRDGVWPGLLAAAGTVDETLWHVLLFLAVAMLYAIRFPAALIGYLVSVVAVWIGCGSRRCRRTCCSRWWR